MDDPNAFFKFLGKQFGQCVSRVPECPNPLDRNVTPDLIQRAFQRTPNPDLLIRHFAGMEDKLFMAAFYEWELQQTEGTQP